MQNDHSIKCSCYDCLQANANHADPVKTLPETLKGKMLSLTKATKFYNKPPGDVFPLNSTTAELPAGKSIGSVSDYKKVDGVYWLKMSLASPQWFPYNANNVSMRVAQKVAPLTDKQKQEIARQALLGSQPNAKLVLAAADVAQGAADVADTALDTAAFLGKNLKWVLFIALLAVVVGIYLKYRD